MKARKMWVTAVCDNHHWQVLCVINPGKEYCIALLLDSLVATPDNRPTNYAKCQQFATALVKDVYGGENMSNRHAISLHIGLVSNQPNFNDCGVFALLSLRNAVTKADELLKFGLMPTFHDFRNWYTVNDGLQYRQTLRERYEDLLDIHGEPIVDAGDLSEVVTMN
jgi:Ulp1 family protease